MDYRDFENLGQQIGNKIRDAVNSFDFDRLNEEIRQNAEDIISGARNTFNDNSGSKKKQWQRRERNYRSSDGYHRENWQTYKKVKPRRENQNRSDPFHEENIHSRTNSSKSKKNVLQDYGFPVERCPKGEVSGILFTVFGALGFALTGFGCMILGITAAFRSLFAPMAIFSGFIPFIIAFIIMIIVGTCQRNRVKRYRKYITAMKGKSFITFKALASLMEKSQRYVIRDVTHMLNLGYFPQGHIDSQKTCLMVTDAIYEQYLETMKNVRSTQDTDAKHQSSSQSSQTDEKILQLEKLGRQYMDAIRKANDDIPDIEISNKLYRMEMIIGKIFEHIKKYPQKADRLTQFQNYYMPMTIKLVETYRDIDGQPVEGENIKKVKHEIEGTLDTINEAYEKLYDSMYQETAMDVSSDISVLRTLLAREGLTKGAFDNHNK